MKKNYFLVAILSFVMVSMTAQVNPFFDDMESYTSGEPIFTDPDGSGANGHWTDWG